jgi:hypothetical protein
MTLARAASTTFLRIRGAEMWERYHAQQRATGAPLLPEPREVFLAGLRIGFEAAFLTILSLEENGGQVGANNMAPPDPVDPVGA